MKVIIQNDYRTFSTMFYLKFERNGRRVIIGRKDGLLVEHIIEETAIINPVEPLLELNDQMAQEFIKGVVDYASDNNIKTVNENLLHGKLAATEKHLEDMRISFTKVLDKLISL